MEPGQDVIPWPWLNTPQLIQLMVKPMSVCRMDEVQGVVGSFQALGVMNDDVCTSYTESIHKNGLNLIEPPKNRQR